MITALWLSVPSPVLAGMPGDDAAWEEIRNDIVRIECVEIGDDPWCRSHGVVAAPLTAVSGTLQNMAEHQDKFESVLSIEVLAPDTLHVTLDFPRGLSDRDYIAKYSRAVDGNVHRYSWVPADATGAPPQEDVVRLSEFGGEWRLEDAGSNTKVTYTWHADVLGDLPGWMMGIARRRAGHEALTDLAHAQGSELVQR